MLRFVLLTVSLSFAAGPGEAVTNVYWTNIETGGIQRAATDTGIVEDVLWDFFRPSLALRREEDELGIGPRAFGDVATFGQVA